MNNGLPFAGNTWEVAAQIVAQRHRQNVAAFITVMSPTQLPAALAQRELPVVIDNVPANRTLLRYLVWFSRYGHWWIIGSLLAYAITHNYQIELSHTVWKGQITIQDKIILTPRGAENATR